MNLLEILSTVVNENTLGGIILASFFTIMGILINRLLTNRGNIEVARIESETTLGTKAIEVMTKALEVLQEENKTLRGSLQQLESHIDTLIEYILMLVKAKSEEEIANAVSRLEQFLRAIGRWPH